MLSRRPSRLHSARVPISLNSTLAPLKIPTSLRQHMMYNSFHQFPALGLRLNQPGFQFITEGHELVQSGEADIEGYWRHAKKADIRILTGWS